MSKIIYLSGKITGEDYDACYEKFTELERVLIRAGHTVINPMKIVPKDTPWVEAMKICLNSLINEANAICMLKDWKESEGAQIEFALATKLGYSLFYETPKNRFPVKQLYMN